MNIINRLLGLGSSLIEDPSAAEVMKIENGQLYLCRPGNLRSPRECLWNNACAAIRRAPSVEHNFQLLITRVFEEDEADILDGVENDDKDFLVGEELEFRTGRSEGEHTLVWRDLDGDVDETYEFVAIGTNKATIDLFASCMYKAMYERKYRISAEAATDAELQQFAWLSPTTSGAIQQPLSSSSSSRPAMEDPSTATPKATPRRSPVSPALAPPISPSAQTVKATPQPAYPSVVTKPAELYLWSNEESCFAKQADVSAQIVRPNPSKFQYWLTASTEEGQLLAHPLGSQLNARWSKKMSGLTWNHINQQETQNSWCFIFQNEEDLKEFQEAYSGCLYESLNEASWAKAKADEQAYLRGSFNEDVEMKDVEDEEDSDEEDEVEANIEETSEEEDSGEMEDENRPRDPDDGARNSHLTVGQMRDKTFVVRGDRIGVFNNGDNSKIEYAGTLKDLGFKGKKGFKPKNIMLHNQDTNMILMNPAQPHSLFKMDIEYGRIVDEWKVHDDITVDYIAPKNKFAPSTAEQTLVGISGNSLFRIDPRVSGNTMVENKQYTTKNKFSGITTTGKGQLAVASEKGDIRLFDTVGKIAKTALPAMGDPILGIDVTADGRWVVATCKPYLLLIDTLIGQGRYAGSYGFDRSFPADAKPMPKRLQLRPEHAAYMGNDISFSPARFNTGEGQDENAIVTSTGRYVIAWDFAKVKKGKLDSYVIKMYEDDVVQDNFRFGDDKQIIVALANDVLALNKNSLKKLPRASLTTPAHRRQSKSAIVNTLY